MARWDSVAILGVGLIGGSIGLALRQRGLCRRVVGIGRRTASLDVALRVGAITEASTDLARAVADVDVVVVCTPVQQIAGQVQQIVAACRPETLITDAGSTKARLITQLDKQLAADVRFVGSHPLAGSDKTGAGNASGDLFHRRVVVVTPTERNTASDIRDTIAFWESFDARVVEMTPSDHDRAVAVTSHLPHVVAAVLAGMTPQEQLSLVAGGWLDTTRVAAADEDLWIQILSENRDNVLDAIGVYRTKLDDFAAALEQGDIDTLKTQLSLGKQRRNAVAS